MPKLVDKTSTPKAEKVKRELAETAYRLFKEKGYDNVGIRDIAAACGVTTGAFYYHFKNKSDALNYRAGVKLHWLFEEALQSVGEKSPLDQIYLFFAEYLCEMIEDDGWALGMDRMFARNFSTNRARNIDKVLAGLVKKAIDAGELSQQDPVEEIVDTLLITYRGVEYDWCIHQGNYDLKAQMRRHIQIVLEHYSEK